MAAPCAMALVVFPWGCRGVCVCVVPDLCQAYLVLWQPRTAIYSNICMQDDGFGLDYVGNIWDFGGRYRRTGVLIE